MTNNKGNIENFKNIPRSWKKFGEVFCNNLEQPIFVCLICLENADSINTAYTTNDGSVFWWHIQQQHISFECETLDKISAEIQSFQTNSFKYEETCEENNIKIDEPAVSDEKMKQNQVNLLEKFHESLVKDNATAIKEAKATLHTLDMQKGTQGSQGPHDNSIESNTTEIDRQNVFEAAKKYIRNLSNCVENKTYTISDDEGEHGNQFCIGERRNVGDYLKHNDMIEISDDETSEDNIETRPTSPAFLEEKQTIIQSADDLESDKHTEPNSIEENTSLHRNLFTGIPTPDTSPCESLTNQQDITNSNFFASNDYACNKNVPLHQTPQISTNSIPPSRTFQCELSGSRTANENTMKMHLEQSHKTFLPGPETNPYSNQVHQSYGNKQQDLVRQTKRFNCKICNRKTKSLMSMERHQQIFHSPHSHLLTKQCEICNKRIFPGNIKQHMDVHFSTGFNCNYCGVFYKHKQTLNTHISKYHPEINVDSPPAHPQHFGMKPNDPVMPYGDRYMPASFTPELEQQVMHQQPPYYLATSLLNKF